MGVWIETRLMQTTRTLTSVTPCMGVWIETTVTPAMMDLLPASHPVWVCGLKLFSLLDYLMRFCHTLYGCVD